MKRIIFFSTVLLWFTAISCEKKTQINELRCPPDYVLKGKQHNILGVWKLVQVTKKVVGTTLIDSIDISCDNVYFKFKNDSILQVIGNSNIFKEEVYKYSYKPIKGEDSLSLPGPNLLIKSKNNGSYCFVEISKMHILHHFENVSVKEIFIRTK